MDKKSEKKNEKKFIQSPIAIICYVLAALMLVYACFQGGSTVNQINEYYSGYGMTAKPSEYIAYVIQAMLEPLLHAITIFMAGYILSAVRKLDPKNYKTAEELAKIEEAKKEAKERKQAAKGEAKAAKVEAKSAKVGFEGSEEESVRADFTESLEAELNEDPKTLGTASVRSKKSSGSSTRKSTGTRSNSKSNYSRSRKSGESKGSGKSSESKKTSGRKTAPKKEEVQKALEEAYNKAEEAVEKAGADE